MGASLRRSRLEGRPTTVGRSLQRVGFVLATTAAVVALAPGVAAARPKPPHLQVPDAIVGQATPASVAVYTVPGGVTPSRVLTNPNQYRGALVLLVTAIRVDGWLQVLLPVRPNGSRGWIHAGDVVLSNDPYRIQVRLSRHQITVTKKSTTILQVPVGVGKKNTPTPGGGYYLTQLFAPPDPNGPYGPYAYSLSGYSDVLTTFQGGDAIIGLHGTNRPDLLGHDVSSGCIRMSNPAITALAKVLPLGTPVTITK
jgi:lipoprotein-anchoring transpeptidase ErfK/SrfK